MEWNLFIKAVVLMLLNPLGNLFLFVPGLWFSTISFSGSCLLALQNLLLGSFVDCLSICLFPVKVHALCKQQMCALLTK